MTLLDSNSMILLNCPECGGKICCELSLFFLNASKQMDITCPSCGKTPAVIINRNRLFELQIKCPVCRVNHKKMLMLRHLLQDKDEQINCQATGLEMCIIASSKDTQETIGQTDIKSPNYFNNPQIMYQILDRLYDIADNGGLYCQCGSEGIKAELFADRLELHCSKCSSLSIIYAETEEDLEVIRQTNIIKLPMNGFRYLDSINSGNNNNKFHSE